MPPLIDAALPAPARGGFTTRVGGRSLPPWDGSNLGARVGDDPATVEQNRAELADALAVAVDDLIFAEQVHGRDVAAVDESDHGRQVPGVDGLVTATPGLALVVLAADCLPVLLVDPVAQVVGAAHAGRAGLVGGVLQETLRVMAGLGAAPARTVAVLGPAVCGACYELPAALADEVDRAVPGTLSRTRAGTPAADLAAGAEGLLRGAGVLAVTRVGGCTAEQPDRFYSYRRDGRTGRHAGVVQLSTRS